MESDSCGTPVNLEPCVVSSGHKKALAWGRGLWGVYAGGPTLLGGATGFWVVSAVSYSPTLSRVQYHRRWRA